MKSLLVALACLTLSACQADPRRCCDQYSPTGPRGVFCLAYRQAVTRYVQGGKDLEAQRQRLAKFKAFYATIALELDDDVLNRRVQDCGIPEFLEQFNRERLWASRDTSISIDERAALIHDGFRHAVYELEGELDRRPQ